MRHGRWLDVDSLTNHYCAFFACCLAATWATAVPQADYRQLVAGVGAVTSGRNVPGPVFPLTPDWVAIVSGDDDASFPSTVVLARHLGQGRVAAFGVEGILLATDLADNAVLSRNVLQWLDVAGRKKVAYTTGHREWVTGASLVRLREGLAPAGFVFSEIGAPITREELSTASVVIVGIAWGDFTEAEIQTVEQFAQAGGGLLLLGLGWSWESHNPGKTVDEYPMNRLGAPLGVRWLRSTISDPSNQADGSPVFHMFYPHAGTGSVYDAMRQIKSAHETRGDDLSKALETDASLRLGFVRSHEMLAVVSTDFGDNDPERQRVFDFYREIVGRYPRSYAKTVQFDERRIPTMTWLRERAWQTWRDCLPLTPDRAAEMATVGRLGRPARQVLEQFGVVLLDNAGLTDEQVRVIRDYLKLVPSALHNLRRISVVDKLGKPATPVSLDGRPGSVNIFGVRVGAAKENSFPADIPTGETDVFSIVVAHELNHVVDAFWIGSQKALSDRRDALIRRAGADSMNYLRSMIAEGFFKNAPQEFFASVANQWFTDSGKTIRLGLARFDTGHREPLNQALFFADVYSQGGDMTWLYTTDTVGHVTRITAPVGRDARGYLNSIELAGNRYLFGLDADGCVVGYSKVRVHRRQYRAVINRTG